MKAKRKQRPPPGEEFPKGKHLRLEALLEAARRIAVSRKRSHLPIDVYSLPAEVIAHRCGVTLATARRWKLGRSRIPYTAAVALSGHMGAMSPEWQGWRIQDDALITPDGDRISQAALVTAMQETLRHGYSSLAQFAKQLHEQVEEQPRPPTDAV